jgi:TRAP transporter 4TM/12TM fusion protein
MQRYARLVITALAVLMSLYHLYTASWGIPEPIPHRATHVAFVLALAFLIFPARFGGERERPALLDWMFAGIAVAATLHVIVDYDRIAYRFPYVSPLTTLDYVFSVALILLILEATRRVIGIPLVIVAMVFLTYGLFGRNLPGALAHTGVEVERLLDHLYLTASGIFGGIVGISATYVFLFVLFGAVFEATGAGKFFMDLATAGTSRVRAGAAKASIVASAMFGTLSGSSVANVYVTGTHTIPLMMRAGLPPSLAAGVEAVASTSGQLVPPIMGSAAFLIADFNQIPYIQVAKAAIIPAAMYLISVFFMVHLEALKLNLGTMKTELKFRSVMLAGWHLLLPLIIIVYLLVSGRTPLFAAFYGIVSSIVVSYVRRHTRLGAGPMAHALAKGAKTAVPVAVALLCAALVVGVVELTGFGLRFTALVIRFSGASLPIAMIMVSVVTIILGMGLPTAAAYLIVAIFGAPALVELGVPMLAAHMFVFYYAILANITPPVAMAAYAAASISGSSMNAAGLSAFRLGLVSYIFPFFMAYQPALLLMGTPAEIIATVSTTLVAVFGVGIAAVGWMMGPVSPLGRAVAFLAALMLMRFEWVSDAVGIVALLLLCAFQYWKRNRVIDMKPGEVSAK